MDLSWNPNQHTQEKGNHFETLQEDGQEDPINNLVENKIQENRDIKQILTEYDDTFLIQLLRNFSCNIISQGQICQNQINDLLIMNEPFIIQNEKFQIYVIQEDDDNNILFQSNNEGQYSNEVQQVIQCGDNNVEQQNESLQIIHPKEKQIQ
ncbi:unnamed protein product [Paramecium pentaurelia]|uniref:Uncharacterized protein n=1 Tax=Paramecium pentaurelia TaxID=43138 RepID=A0A8S1X3Q0_9CILI|nr:unnamed protein product [Paramecium pentaurelia]